MSSHDIIFEFSEERRDDSELLKKVEIVYKARQAALWKAAEQLKEVADELQKLQIFKHGNIFDRCLNSAWSTYNKVWSDAEFMQTIGSETYTSNLAASELGYQIQEMGDDFYLHFPEEK